MKRLLTLSPIFIFASFASANSQNISCNWIRNDVVSIESGQVLAHNPSPVLVNRAYSLQLGVAARTLSLTTYSNPNLFLVAYASCQAEEQRPNFRCYSYQTSPRNPRLEFNVYLAEDFSTAILSSIRSHGGPVAREIQDIHTCSK